VSQGFFNRQLHHMPSGRIELLHLFSTEGDLSTDIAGLSDAKAGCGIPASGMVFCPVGG
jgi:hypothetical protein